VRHEPNRWLFEAVQRLRGEPARVLEEDKLLSTWALELTRP
jgi:hypothetical protein